MTLLLFSDPLKGRRPFCKPQASKQSLRPQQSTQSLPSPPQSHVSPNFSTLTLSTQFNPSLQSSPPLPLPSAHPGWLGSSPPPTYQQANPSAHYLYPPPAPSPQFAVATSDASSAQYLPSYHSSPPSSPPLPPRPSVMASSPPAVNMPGPTHSNSYPPPRLSTPPPDANPSSKLSCPILSTTARLASKSMSNLNTAFTNKTTEYLAQGAALCDAIGSKLDAVITCIDGEEFSGEEGDLVIYEDIHVPASRAKPRRNPTLPGSNYFAKSWLYANSRLPQHQMPLKVYLPTWPLLCLAAQYSERVYDRVSNVAPEAEVRVNADWRKGTKAMVLKSVVMDESQAIVFAIRGSQTFMDWAVNFRPAPSSPEGFLDDPGNLCHAGFLHVARSMIGPVSARLRDLLQENPTRSKCSLIITGHSAGGAVAALLYAHMLSSNVCSELTYLTGFFKRVHCITFGSPPVSLLPLTKSEDQAHRQSLFFSFINEGDPVARADRETVLSLLRLYAGTPPAKGERKKWNMPTSSLSLAGRIVVLRVRGSGSKGRKEGPGRGPIEACVVDDEKLRKVVYGDPVMHMMKVYVRRIEELATRAVTAQGY